NITEHLKELTKGDSTKISSCEISEVTGFNNAYSLNDRTRTFLKVQDGCDYTCTFCTIPQARGKSRSDSIANVLDSAKKLAENGNVKEIVLTGINLGDFGKGPDGNKKSEESFLDLISALDDLDGVDRYRISSIEPNLLTDEIIDFVANSKRFMPHFHVPLQSGSDHILGMMRRRYQRDLYQERVEHIKRVMPDCAIGVDVIVGFPGEEDSYFQETYDFLHGLDVTYFHVFTYSERARTKALEITPVIPMHVRHERNKILRNLSYKKQQYFNEVHRGETRKVLFEDHNKNGMMEGYTDNYIRVSAPFKEDWSNQIVDWELR
ncbi:MAG: tRNA (N(6)-L-threonylcarbamoyladenosine(37)-C(2))-methylthiotransferase MtaB, partial [Pseudopedobacter saltans]